jgi:hypothetical protein
MEALFVLLPSVPFILILCGSLISNFEKWTVRIATEENDRSGTGSRMLLRRRRNALLMRSTIVVDSGVVSALLGIRGTPRKRTNFQRRIEGRIVGIAKLRGEKVRQE